jgi:PhoPQ-activated pathogenicity-related protein
MLKIISLLMSAAMADILNDYISAPDDHYQWYEKKELAFNTLWGNRARVLNLTSQKWMDESRAAAPGGSIWTHEVIVIIPKTLKHKNIGTVYLTGDCNDKPEGTPISKNDMDVMVVDEMARNSQSITVAVK